jgi:hypothetical protein
MPIDPNIPLQAKTVQLESPMNQLAMYGNAMKIGEMQREIGTQNKMRELFSKGIDVSTPEGFNQLASIDPSAAIKLRRDALEGVKLQGDIKKTSLDLTEKSMGIMRERTKDVLQNTSNENYIAHMQEGVRDGLVTPDQAKRSVQIYTAIPPNQRVAYLQQGLAKAEEIYKMNTISKSQQADLGIKQGHLDIARENQQRGTIPAGYRMSADGKTLEAIPGGPTTVPLAPKELQAREAKYPLATQAVKTVESKADRLITDIETLKTHPGLDSITGTVYGRTPSVTKEGRQAQALYDSIVARGGFQELAAMRAASPTGGALGNVSNQEGQQLKDAFGTLNRTQDAADLRIQLGRVADDVRGAKQRVREAYDMTYDYKASAPSSGNSDSGGKKADPLGIR